MVGVACAGVVGGVPVVVTGACGGVMDGIETARSRATMVANADSRPVKQHVCGMCAHVASERLADEIANV